MSPNQIGIHISNQKEDENNVRRSSRNVEMYVRTMNKISHDIN